MTFSELLTLVSSPRHPAIRIDSRAVGNGDIFVAIKGTTLDGHDFIDRAIANGAKYVVCQESTTRERAFTRASAHPQYELITVDNSAKAAAILAQASKGNPASRLTNLAVTGTNGKTTVAFLARACVQAMGKKCGLIGTITYDTGSSSCPAALTTPDCLTIAAAQEQMLKAGAEYMIIEASSHALSQDRLAGIDFRAAAFTNLAGEHMDYHRTSAAYLAAKTRLFSCLPREATAVLNKQSAQSKHIARNTNAKILWYAVDEPADIRADIQSMNVNGTVFALDYAGQRRKVVTPLPGRYNVANHLATAGLCLSAGLDLETIAVGLSALQIIPGRLEKIDAGGFSVVIDYAHTDDALKNVLATLKPLCEGRLTVVFGCGGDRDKTKRPRMARVAQEFADLIIVTSDNPRTESPGAIIDDIVAGFKDPASEAVMIEPDRRNAIEQSIKAARTGDIIIIAGKGHETYQIFGDKRYDFSDKAVAQECLRRQS